MPPKYYYKNTTKEECDDAKNNQCAVCKDKRRFTDYALCENCKLWFHPKCLGLNPKSIKNTGKEQPFICRNCDININSPDVQDLTTVTNEPVNASYDGTFGPFDQDVLPNQSNLDISLNSEGMPNTNTFANLFNDGGDLPDFQQHDAACGDEPAEAEEALNTTDEENISSTDEEGYKEIGSIESHKGQGNNLQFLVKFKKCETQKWLWFKHCDGAVDLIEKYCSEKEISHPKLKKRGNKDGSNSGAGNLKSANKAAWVSIDEVIRTINIYGEKGSLKPEILKELGDQDKLVLFEIGNHCFAALYLAESKTCIIADGENTFASSRTTRGLVLYKLKQAKYVKCIPYWDQPAKDLCGSSCASIAIAMQKMYLTKNFMDKVIVAKTIRKRVESSLHSEQGSKLNIFKPLKGDNWKTNCENCGYKFSTKNRGAMNLHKCPKK